MSLNNSDNYANEESRIYIALREVEIEEQAHPESISEEESNLKIRKIFDRWGINYPEM